MSEIRSLDQKATRLRLVPQKLFAVVERDMSGFGNACWKTLFLSLCEDKFPGNDPTLVVKILDLYNRWQKKIVEETKSKRTGISFKAEEARKLLIVASYMVTVAKTERVSAMASIVGLLGDVKMDEWQQQKQQQQSQFQLPYATAVPQNGQQSMLDDEYVLSLWLCALRENAANWSHESELRLVKLVHIAYAMHRKEKRTVTYTHDQCAVQMRNLSKWTKNFQSTTKKLAECAFAPRRFKTNAKSMEWHLWYMLLSCVNETDSGLRNIQKHDTLNQILLAWWEVTLCDCGQGFLNFLSACMLVGRWRHEIAAQCNSDEATESVSGAAKRMLDMTEVKAGLELYTKLDHRWNPNNPDMGKTAPIKITKEQLVARRSLAIPDWVIDKHVFRGKGHSTHPARIKFLSKSKLEYLDLTQEQWNMSHGPGKTYKDDKTGPMAAFWEHLETMKSDSDKLYFDIAKRLYMEEAERRGYRNAKSAYVAERLYKSEWINRYGLDHKEEAMKEEEEEEDDDDDSEDPDKDEDEEEEQEQPPKKKRKMEKKDESTNDDETIRDAKDVLSEQDLQLLRSGEAPLAQRPCATKYGTGCNKKKVMVLTRGVLKGGYDCNNKQSKDMATVDRVTRRVRVLADIWNDTTIVKQQQLRYDGVLYLYSTFACSGKTLTVQQLRSNSSPMSEQSNAERILDDYKTTSLLGTVRGRIHMSQLANSNDDRCFEVVRNFLGRYLLGIGDAHMDNMLFVLSEDGSIVNSVHAIDLDEQRPPEKVNAAARVLEAMFSKLPSAEDQSLWKTKILNRSSVAQRVRAWLSDTVLKSQDRYMQTPGASATALPDWTTIDKRANMLLSMFAN